MPQNSQRHRQAPGSSAKKRNDFTDSQNLIIADVLAEDGYKLFKLTLVPNSRSKTAFKQVADAYNSASGENRSADKMKAKLISMKKCYALVVVFLSQTGTGLFRRGRPTGSQPAESQPDESESDEEQPDESQRLSARPRRKLVNSDGGPRLPVNWMEFAAVGHEIKVASRSLHGKCLHDCPWFDTFQEGYSLHGEKLGRNTTHYILSKVPCLPQAEPDHQPEPVEVSSAERDNASHVSHESDDSTDASESDGDDADMLLNNDDVDEFYDSQDSMRGRPGVSLGRLPSGRTDDEQEDSPISIGLNSSPPSAGLRATLESNRDTRDFVSVNQAHRPTYNRAANSSHPADTTDTVDLTDTPDTSVNSVESSRPPRTTAESFQTETRRNRRRRAHTHDEARRDRDIAASTDADANLLNVLTCLIDTSSSFKRRKIELDTQKHEDLKRIQQKDLELRKRQGEEELELRKRQAESHEHIQQEELELRKRQAERDTKSAERDTKSAERDTKSAEFRDKLQELADGAFMNYLSGVENDKERFDLISNYMKHR